MIIDFEHRQGGHCESGVTTNLLRHHGIKNITEPLVLGIGSGLYFSYLPFLKLQFAPVFSYRVLPGQIFNRTTKALGVKMFKRTFKNPKESMDVLDSNLEKGIPTGLQVGAYDLTFFPPEYRMHYNMHNMIVFGKENGEYIVGDPVLENPQRISYDDLMKVRFPKGPFAPNGKMYYPVLVPQNIDFRPAIVAGIKKTSYELTKIPFPLIGTKGMRMLSKAMAKWPEKHGQKKANYYLGQVLRMQEEVGTGGGGFRYMYGAFLHQASEILEQPWLKEMSVEMGNTANEWRRFAYLGAKNCKKRGDIEVSYQELSKMLYDLSKREDKIFKSLSKISLQK
jgi:hypothetical protein